MRVFQCGRAPDELGILPQRRKGLGFQPPSGYFSSPGGISSIPFEILISILARAWGIGSSGWRGATGIRLEEDVRCAPRFGARLRTFRARACSVG